MRKMSISSAEKERAIVLFNHPMLSAILSIDVVRGGGHKKGGGLCQDVRLWATAVGDPVAIELLVGSHDDTICELTGDGLD